jgi:hypothetical protein
MSRFERGEIELADDVVSQLAIPLGLDYEDLVFRLILSEENLEDWRCLASEAWDVERAKHLLTKLRLLQVPGMRNDFLTVAISVIDELLSIHAEGRQNMSSAVVAQLDDYLINLDEFSRLEGIVFSVSLEYVPLVTGWGWVKRQVRMMSQENVEPQVIRRLISFVAVVGERAAIEHQLNTMATIIDEMWRLDSLIPENAVQRYNLIVLDALYQDFIKSTLESHQHLVDVIDAGELIFSPDVHQSMMQYTVAQGWTRAEDFQD